MNSTNSRPDVSLIIVNWNTKDLVLKCIQSTIDTRGEYSHEIIVVDNASSDGSVEAIEQKYNEVVVIKNENNLGFARANNIGIKRSSGRYVCLINSDVQVMDGTIRILIEYMDENPGVGIVGPKVLWPDMALQDSCRKYPSLWNNLCESMHLDRLFPESEIFSSEHMMYFDHNRLIEVDGLVGCFMMIRKSIFNDVGLFDERFFIYSEEIDLCKRCKEAGWKIIFNPMVSSIHYGGGSSKKNPLYFSLEQVKSKIKYWRKHHKKMSLYLFKILLTVSCIVRLLCGHLIVLFNHSKRDTIEPAIQKNKELLGLISKI